MFRMFPFTLLVVALALAARVVGLAAGPIELYAALLLLALALAVPRRGDRAPAHWGALVFGLIGIALGVAVLAARPDDRVFRLLAFALFIGGTAFAFCGAGYPRRTFHAGALAALLSGTFFLIVLYSPLAWIAWTRASLAVSGQVGRLIGRPLALGPSYSGFDVTVLILFALFAVQLFANTRAWRLIAALLYAFVVLVGYLVAMAFIPALRTHLDGTPPPEFMVRHVPWNLPAALLLLQLPALWIAGARGELRPRAAPDSRPRDHAWAAAFAVTILAAAVALVVRPVEFRDTRAVTPRPKVVLYEKGYFNWGVPTRGQFGPYSAGMLGRLPIFLRQLGFDAVVSPTLDDNALSDAQVVFILNPKEVFPPEVSRRLFEFVRQGGSLLVVGEHTWLADDGGDTLNDLLASSDIRVNFDSAYYRIGGWIESCGYSPDPLFAGFRQDLAESGVNVGASLHAGWKAIPLLWGTHSWADAGVRENRPQLGYLGNSAYDVGEQLGDVLLMAEQRIGRGRLVVVGDTTGFINLLMIHSHEVVARLFDKLASPPIERHDVARIIISLAFFAAGVAACVGCWRRPVVAVLLVAAAVSGLALWRQSVESAANSPVARGRVAIIDASHHNAFSRENWNDDSLAGLYLNLMRSDVQPLMYQHWSREALKEAQMLFIVAPIDRFSKSELDDIRRFMNSGGSVIVSADPDQAEALAPLLDECGLRVRNKPLGPFITNCALGGTVRFYVGYMVDSSDKRNLLCAGFESLSAGVIYEHRYSRNYELDNTPGHRLVLIADPQFFTCKNLEPEKGDPITENASFIWGLVNRLMPPASETQP